MCRFNNLGTEREFIVSSIITKSLSGFFFFRNFLVIIFYCRCFPNVHLLCNSRVTHFRPDNPIAWHTNLAITGCLEKQYRCSFAYHVIGARAPCHTLHNIIIGCCIVVCLYIINMILKCWSRYSHALQMHWLSDNNERFNNRTYANERGIDEADNKLVNYICYYFTTLSL